MLQLSDAEKSLFPLSDIGTVVKFFKSHLEVNNEPNLAICSIIIGYIENALTCSRVIDSIDEVENELNVEDMAKHPLSTKLPVIEYDNVMALYHRFVAIIRTHVDVTSFGSSKYASRDLVKRVSDVVWCTLCSTYYKDRAHLQSIYSYMTGAKLDSTGTTLAVVAALQCLGYHDTHLSLSEDHSWVVCGTDKEISVEVTWHGKGNEDKRGISVTEDVYHKSWLYVNGKSIVCTRYMEVAVMVSNMNPGINATIDSEEVLLLQQALLWLLYDMGHLSKYPMGLDNLADLEEMNPTSNRLHSAKIYEEAILSNISHYDNQHVYPYTYLAGYCYRNQHYKLALRAWARAAKVMKNYNYSRDDEEIYKEFLDVSTELIPHLVRVCSSASFLECHPELSVLNDPASFSALLEFYDGICLWEEGSSTPILHIGWAKALQSSIAKFDAKARSKLNIICAENDMDSIENIYNVERKEDLDLLADVKNLCSEKILLADQNANTSKLVKNKIEVISKAVCESTVLHLHSAKMKGLKDLVLADKPNSQAISLLLSAQSQVTLSKKRDRGSATSASSAIEGDTSLAFGGGRLKRNKRE